MADITVVLVPEACVTDTTAGLASDAATIAEGFAETDVAGCVSHLVLRFCSPATTHGNHRGGISS